MTLDGYNNLKSDKSLTKDDVPMGTCMNGELGKIIDIDDENIIAQFDEDILVFDKGSRNKLLLGYSLNSYKMQGSEIPYAITVVLPQFQKSLSKNMIYTDMSRAKKELVEIVDDDTVANSITIDTIADRQTSMQDIFKEICA
jgi:ATP-dependent exoDNAse (exonuclease V) alpha subunit